MDTPKIQRRLLALFSLLEVLAVATARDRAQRPIQRRLANGLAKIFDRQGRRFIRDLEQRFADRFPADSERASLAEAVTDPEWEPLFDAIADATADRMASTVNGASQASVRAAGDGLLKDLGLRTSFPLSPATLDFLQRQAAQLVTNVNAETKRQIRTILTAAAKEGWSWQKTARALRDKFSAFSAPARGPKALRNRAQLIAVTEVGNAFESGRLMAARAVQDRGIDLEKSWLTVGDDRVSQMDRANAAQGWIPLNDSFPSGHERPLSHPGCRCTLLVRRIQE